MYNTYLKLSDGFVESNWSFYSMFSFQINYVMSLTI